jgi:hypothetical protein
MPINLANIRNLTTRANIDDDDALLLVTSDGTINKIMWSQITASTKVPIAFQSFTGASGTEYVAGFYDFSGTNNDFSPSITWGGANHPYEAHVLFVTGALTVDEVTITVTGTSMADDGTRTASDSEAVVIPNATAANSYFETSKKFIGQVTIETTAGTAIQCNYGWAKYFDDKNSDFIVDAIEVSGIAGANDAGFDIRLLHHKTTGWTYNAGADPTPPTPIVSAATTWSTESDLDDGEKFAFKRTGIGQAIEGSGSEGILVAFVTTQNGAVELATGFIDITSQ